MLDLTTRSSIAEGLLLSSPDNWKGRVLEEEIRILLFRTGPHPDWDLLIVFPSLPLEWYSEKSCAEQLLNLATPVLTRFYQRMTHLFSGSHLWQTRTLSEPFALAWPSP